MTRVDTDADVEMTLEFARVAREPSAEDRLRILGALRTRLGQAGAPPALGEAPPPNLAPLDSRASTVAIRQNAALHQLVLVAAMTGAAGFYFGSSVGHTPPTTAAPSVAAVEGGPERAASASPSTLSGRESLITPSSSSPHGAPSASAELDTSPATPRTAASSTDLARGRQTHQQKKKGGTATDLAPAALEHRPRFLEAVRLVQRAQRAVDGGEPALALALLDQLDARFPPELLGEERQVARVLALCASGEADRAARAAEKLTAKSSRSIYAARVERSCAGSSKSAESER